MNWVGAAKFPTPTQTYLCDSPLLLHFLLHDLPLLSMFFTPTYRSAQFSTTIPLCSYSLVVLVNQKDENCWSPLQIVLLFISMICPIWSCEVSSAYQHWFQPIKHARQWCYICILLTKERHTFCWQRSLMSCRTVDRNKRLFSSSEMCRLTMLVVLRSRKV